MSFLHCALVLVLIAEGCSATSDAAGQSAAPGPPPVPVEIAEVKPVKLRETSEYLATLRSRQSVRVQPQVEGWVTDIPVTSGDPVQRGAVLMRIDARRQVAAVRGLQANVAAREADLGYWTQQVRRLELLYRGGGASRQELDQARSSFSSAQAAVNAQEQQVRGEAVELHYYGVSAPEAGTVGDIPVRVGDLVTTQTLLTTIDHNEALEAYVELPVEEAARVRMGTPVEIVPYPGADPIASQVSFIAPRVSPEQTVLIKSWIGNPAAKLRNAQLVRARLIWSERVGPEVPVLAVQMLNGQNFVWVAQPGGGDGTLVADQRAVQVGPIVGQSYPVERGLQPRDRVIVSGVQKLRRGAKVVPAQPGGPPPGKMGP